MCNERIIFANTPQVWWFVITFILTGISGLFILPLLKRFKLRQTVRDDGPQTHLKKTGTPVMGGLIFLIPILIMSVVFSPLIPHAPNYSPEIIPLAMVTLGFGFVGFLDDWIKTSRKSKDGLRAWQKMTFLFLVSCFFVLYLYRFTDVQPNLMIPFTGTQGYLELGWHIYAPFAIAVLLATTNAVNLTDGLDGLAAGITMVVLIFMTYTAMQLPEWYQMKMFSAIVAGACCGFLIFNLNPAKVFMGDSGSLALGGTVGALAVMMNIPLILIIAGGIYVLEAISVMIQVGYYKLTKKRVFKMAPLHHHFELCGWKETKVVYAFWIVTVVLCIIAALSVTMSWAM